MCQRSMCQSKRRISGDCYTPDGNLAGSRIGSVRIANGNAIANATAIAVIPAKAGIHADKLSDRRSAFLQA